MTAPASPLQPIHVGKVRDSYPIGGVGLLVVASDRISAFDWVLAPTIPDKGRVLTAMTEFWLTEVLPDIPNHLISTDLDRDLPTAMKAIPDLAGRSMIVKRADMLMLECIERGYLYGSVMDEYRDHGTVCGINLPPGLQKASRFVEPLFTPSTKAERGKHDENITLDAAAELVGGWAVLERISQLSLEVYQRAAAFALERGIILADTKLEWGWVDGELTLCDEVLTPDSSRFWPLDSWHPGQEPVSMDKQFVRNYLLNETDWDRKSPPPRLPDAVVDKTRQLYLDIYRQLTGRSLAT